MNGSSANKVVETLPYLQIMPSKNCLAIVRGEEKFKLLVCGLGKRVDCASQYIRI
jgi:hypothetical protein